MFASVGKTVLAAVQFHIQFRFLAKEIEIVNADGMLAAEFVAGKRRARSQLQTSFSAHVSFLRSWRARSMSAMRQI
jgi:hypothetical protein